MSKFVKPSSADKDQFESYQDERKQKGRRRHDSGKKVKNTTKWYDRMN